MKPSDAELAKLVDEIATRRELGAYIGTQFVLDRRVTEAMREVGQRVRDEATKAERERAAGNAEAFSSRTAYAHDIAAAIRAGEE